MLKVSHYSTVLFFEVYATALYEMLVHKHIETKEYVKK